MARHGGAVLQAFVFRDDEFVGTDVFADSEVRVGRDPETCDLVLDDPGVSREHAVIEHNNKTVFIRDLGSTNGVFVNGAKIDGKHELERLDEASIGPFTVKMKLTLRGRRTSGAKRTPPPAGEPTEFLDAPAKPSRGVAEHEISDPGLDDGATEQVEETATGARGPGWGWSQDAETAQGIEQDKLERSPTSRGGQPVGSRPAQRERERPRKREPGSWADRLKDVGAAMRRAVDNRRAAEGPRSFVGEGSGEFVTDDLIVRLEEGPSLAPPPRGDDDDDDEDAPYAPPYSLAKALLREDKKLLRRNLDVEPWVEILSLFDDRLMGADMLRPGQSFWIGPKLGPVRRLRASDLPPRLKLLDHKRNGECRVLMSRGMEAQLKRHGEEQSLRSHGSQSWLQKRRGTVSASVVAGDVVDLTADGGHQYHVRFVTPPVVATDERPMTERLMPSNLTVGATGTSFSAHMAAVIAVSLMMPAETLQRVGPQDEFVEVTIEEKLELEEPPPPEEPPPEEPKVQPPSRPEPVPRRMQPSRKKRPRPGGTSKAPAGVLGLLNKRGSSKAPGPAAAVAAVSNLTAAKVPGTSSGYRVSPLMGKLPTSDLSVGGGGGGLVTRGGAALLKGGKGGAGRLSGKGKRGVGGLVQKMPQAMRSTGQGHLDREAIQKVINANIGQIQRCYERELLKNPALSGKVTIEWTVSLTGSVRSARQKSSSLNSTGVVSCIIDRIRTWRFPRPKGGEVVVAYPFMFKSIGF